MLTQVHFQNLRALADVTIDLEPFTVLVGPNGCGKSTVLDEIERMCAMTHPWAFLSGQPANTLAGPGSVLTAQGGLPPRTTGHLGPARWRGASPDGDFELLVPEPNAAGWSKGASVHVGTQSGTVRLEEGKQGSEETEKLGREVNALLGGSFRWRAQRLAPQRLSLLRPSLVNAPTGHLDPTGYGLATLLLHMAANWFEEYAALQADLKKVVPHFERLSVVQTEQSGIFDQAGNQSPAYALELSFKGAGRIPAERASEGTLFALTLLAALHCPAMPTLILIDDIDHGLHLSAQFQIIQAIRAVMARRPELQVICTSHSPFLFEKVRGEEVRVMALDANGHSRIKPLTAHPDYARWARGLTTGEVWATVGEDWVTRD